MDEKWFSFKFAWPVGYLASISQWLRDRDIEFEWLVHTYPAGDYVVGIKVLKEQAVILKLKYGEDFIQEMLKHV